jgi:hypothetical protein
MDSFFNAIIFPSFFLKITEFHNAFFLKLQNVKINFLRVQRNLDLQQKTGQFIECDFHTFFTNAAKGLNVQFVIL